MNWKPVLVSLSVMFLIAGPSLIPEGMAYSSVFMSESFLATSVNSVDICDPEGNGINTVVTDSFVYIKNGNSYSVSDSTISSGLALSVTGKTFSSLEVEISDASGKVTSVTFSMNGTDYPMVLSNGSASVSIAGSYSGDIPFSIDVQLSSYLDSSVDLGYVTFTLSDGSGGRTSVQTARCTVPLKSLIISDFEEANKDNDGLTGTEGDNEDVPFHIRDDDPVNGNPVALVSVFEDGDENIVHSNTKFSMSFMVPEGYRFCILVTLQGTFRGENDLTVTIGEKDYKVVGALGMLGSAYLSTASSGSTTVSIFGNPTIPNERNWFVSDDGPVEVGVRGTRNDDDHELQLRIVLKPVSSS